MLYRSSSNLPRVDCGSAAPRDSGRDSAHSSSKSASLTRRRKSLASRATGPEMMSAFAILICASAAIQSVHGGQVFQVRVVAVVPQPVNNDAAGPPAALLASTPFMLP